MSTTEMERLVSAYGADSSLQTSLDGAGDLDAAMEIIRAAGFDVTADEAKARYRAAAQNQAQGELTGKQLDAVAGGGGGFAAISHFSAFS